MLGQAAVDLAGLLVLLQVDILLERVQLLVELAPDLHLCCLEVQLVGLVELQALIVAVDSRHGLLDEVRLGARDYVVKEDALTILIRPLDRTKQVTHDELRDALEVLQEVFDRRDLQVEHVDDLVLLRVDPLVDLELRLMLLKLEEGLL